MIRRACAGILLMTAMSMFAIADVTTMHELRIAIDDGTPDGQFFIDLDDAGSGIDLSDMQMGESRSIVGESGRSVLVTRVANGLELNIDGRIVEVPDFAESPDFVHLAANDAVSIDQEMIRAVHVVDDGSAVVGDDGIVIVSPGRIDDATRDGIRSLLSSAGHADDVTFLDAESGVHQGHAIDEEREIRIIERKVNATN